MIFAELAILQKFTKNQAKLPLALIFILRDYFFWIRRPIVYKDGLSSFPQLLLVWHNEPFLEICPNLPKFLTDDVISEVLLISGQRDPFFLT